MTDITNEPQEEINASEEEPSLETMVDTNTDEMPVDDAPVDELAENPDDDDSEPAGDFSDTDDDIDSDDIDESAESTSGLKRGDLIEGAVIKNTPTEVLIDVGAAKPGIVNNRELEYLTKTTLDTMEEGNSVWVYVLSPANREGHPVLSIGRAAEERDWQEAEDYYKSKEVYHGKISGYNKGGLIVRFGRLRGFIPASQISASRRAKAEGETPEQRWGEMVEDAIAVKVVEIKRSRNRLILSEQAAQAEMRAMEKSKLMEDLKVGEVRTGTVTSLTDFGAFVDIGGADGLVHVTELSWQHVDHPSEMLNIGDEVEVQVISVDENHNRIGLSMRTLTNDPWQAVEDEYVVGQLIQATITKLTKFGAFARLVDHPDIEGLVHVSELAEHRVKHPREMVNVGDVITLRIVKIDHDQRRLGLSLKRVDSPEYKEVDLQMLESDLDDE